MILGLNVTKTKRLWRNDTRYQHYNLPNYVIKHAEYFETIPNISISMDR